MLILSPKDIALIVMTQRKKLKLSQEEVSRRVGIKQQTISDFENHPEGTKLETLFHILSAVNLDLSAISKNKTTTQWKEEW